MTKDKKAVIGTDDPIKPIQHIINMIMEMSCWGTDDRATITTAWITEMTKISDPIVRGVLAEIFMRNARIPASEASAGKSVSLDSLPNSPGLTKPIAAARANTQKKAK